MVYNDARRGEDGKTPEIRFLGFLVVALSLGAALVPALPASAETLAALPRAAAPLGLRFGMTPDQVSLPVVVAPQTPWAVPRARAAPVAATPADPAAASGPRRVPVPGAVPGAKPLALFAPGKTPVPARRPDAQFNRPIGETPVPAPRAQRQGWAETYIHACEAAFDSMSNLGDRSEGWRAWRMAHVGGGEGTDFADIIAERARDGTYRDSAELASKLGARRAGGLYRFDPADARRVACLLFTVDGLAQVFIAGPALEGLRDAVMARLDQRDRRSDLATYTLMREAERFSLTQSRPACGVYCRVFGEQLLVQRRFWLDEISRVLIAAKRYVTVSGLASAFGNDATGRELVDGLPDSFIVYSDLGRRARIVQTLIEPDTAAGFSVGSPPIAASASPPAAAAADTPPTAGDRSERLIGRLVP